MKKLLLVLMVVAMLTVASGAFASSTNAHGNVEEVPANFSLETAKKVAAQAVKTVKTQAATEAETTAITTALASFLGDVDADDIITDFGTDSGITLEEADAHDISSLTSTFTSESNALAFLGAYVPKMSGVGRGKTLFIPLTIDFDNILSNSSYLGGFHLFPKGTGAAEANSSQFRIVDAAGAAVTLERILANTTDITADTKVFLVVKTADNALGIAADTVDLAPVLPVVANGTERPLGSSGGGCAMGSSALALAVLGAFMAMRKK